MDGSAGAWHRNDSGAVDSSTDDETMNEKSPLLTHTPDTRNVMRDYSSSSRFVQGHSSPSICPFFHSRLKTYLFHNSFPTIYRNSPGG